MRFPYPCSRTVAVLGLVLGVWVHSMAAEAAGKASREPAVTAASPFVLPKGGETLNRVQAEMASKVARVSTLSCTLELSKDRDNGKRPKVKVGPLELARGQGGRVSLSRKGQTEEYIANCELLWSYDHKDKKAKYVPANLPVVSGFVQEALRLNVFMAVDAETLMLRGSQLFEGTECWVLEGRSPSKLKMVGVPVEKIRVWVAKSDGLPRKIVVPDQKHTTIVFRDIAVNVKLDPKRFQWKAPKGVEEQNVFGF